MLRGENLACGTSTTGTGSLTLAAVPSAVGAVDLYAWLTATGNGFVNGNAVLVSYVITEYTDSTFVKPKVTEKGIGTLTLGASLAASTLARTTPQVKADANGDTYGVNPTAFSIGTAANTLVFVGPAATDGMVFSPYFETSIGDALGVVPYNSTTTAGGATASLVTATDYYQLFEWRVPMLVKKATVRVNTAYSGGTPVSNAYMRLYAINSSGRPGKLLLDLGLLGTAGASLNSTGNVSTAVHASGHHLLPGEYFTSFIPVLSGGVTAPKLVTPNAVIFAPAGRMGSSALIPYGSVSSTGGTGTPAPDPANVSSYAGSVGLIGGGTGFNYSFALAPS